MSLRSRKSRISKMTDVARRMARSRERKKRGMISIRIDVRDHERAQMVTRGLLAAGAENDARAVRDAVHTLLDRSFPAKALSPE
jgi:hypothetical protein